MIKNSQFYKDVIKAEKLINKTNESLLKVKEHLDNNDKLQAYHESFNYVKDAEDLVNNARLMPIATGYINALDLVSDVIIESNQSIVKYIDEDIFYLKIPSILPKKEKGNQSYIRATVKYALDDYFENNSRKIIDDKVVIVFKHNYSKDRSERELRDHDNIEINAVVDLLALYVLIDDSPLRCNHYYLTEMMDEDSTEVFIVPEIKFPNFIKSISKKD